MTNNQIGGLVVGLIVVVGGIAALMYGFSGTADTITPAPAGSANAADTTTASTTAAETTSGVVTASAITLTASTATLRGVVTTKGVSTAYWFEYSADPLLGAVLNRTTTRTTLVGGAGAVNVQANVSGLSTSTKYYYRIVAENTTGTVHGETATFNTN